MTHFLGGGREFLAARGDIVRGIFDVGDHLLELFRHVLHAGVDTVLVFNSQVHLHGEIARGNLAGHLFNDRGVTPQLVQDAPNNEKGDKNPQDNRYAHQNGDHPLCPLIGRLDLGSESILLFQEGELQVLDLLSHFLAEAVKGTRYQIVTLDNDIDQRVEGDGVVLLLCIDLRQKLSAPGVFQFPVENRQLFDAIHHLPLHPLHSLLRVGVEESHNIKARQE